MATATVQQRRPGDEKYIRSRLAIHEAAHAAANFILGIKIVSIHIGKNEGTVFHAKTDDSYAACVGKFAPSAYERCFGLPPSGDPYDFDQVTATLRRVVAPAKISEARSVLETAAGNLVVRGPFDTLVHALSPVLLKEGIYPGDEVEDLFMAALDREARLFAKPKERHGRPRSTEAAYDPWYQEIDRKRGSRVVYRGADRAEAHAVHARTPDSLLVGSVFGG